MGAASVTLLSLKSPCECNSGRWLFFDPNHVRRINQRGSITRVRLVLGVGQRGYFGLSTFCLGPSGGRGHSSNNATAGIRVKDVVANVTTP